MLIFTNSHEYYNKRDLLTQSKHINNSIAHTTTTKERRIKNLSRKNVKFLKSLGLLVKKNNNKNNE